MTAITLVWANLAKGQPPDIDGAVTVVATLLGACNHAPPDAGREQTPTPTQSAGTA